MSTRGPLTDAVLQHLRDLSDRGSGPIWSALDDGQGRIQIGEEPVVTLQVSNDEGPVAGDDLELIAQARTYLPLLVDEIARLRADG